MTVLGNRFELLHRLGAGGMAEVYCARDRRLGREVAIKLLNAACSRDPGIIERFRQESSALARLSHPNIVTLLDTGETDDGRFYLVMERLRGEALSDLFRRLRGRGEVVSWRRLVGMVRQVCLALQAAHSQQIVHRDIKPSNLFRLEHSLEGEDMIKILDFGIAKFVASANTGEEEPIHLTASGHFVGTAHYAAPEAIEPELFGPVDARADVYGLGVILYQGVTGKLPHDGQPRAAVLYKTAFEEPPPLRARAPQVSEAIEALVMRCMARRPQERFAGVRELGEALAAVAETKTLLPPESRTVRVHGLRGEAVFGPRAAEEAAVRESPPGREVPQGGAAAAGAGPAGRGPGQRESGGAAGAGAGGAGPGQRDSAVAAGAGPRLRDSAMAAGAGPGPRENVVGAHAGSAGSGQRENAGAAGAGPAKKAGDAGPAEADRGGKGGRKFVWSPAGLASAEEASTRIRRGPAEGSEGRVPAEAARLGSRAAQEGELQGRPGAEPAGVAGRVGAAQSAGAGGVGVGAGPGQKNELGAAQGAAGAGPGQRQESPAAQGAGPRNESRAAPGAAGAGPRNESRAAQGAGAAGAGQRNEPRAAQGAGAGAGPGPKNELRASGATSGEVGPRSSTEPARRAEPAIGPGRASVAGGAKDQSLGGGAKGSASARDAGAGAVQGAGAERGKGPSGGPREGDLAAQASSPERRVVRWEPKGGGVHMGSEANGSALGGSRPRAKTVPWVKTRLEEIRREQSRARAGANGESAARAGEARAVSMAPGEKSPEERPSSLAKTPAWKGGLRALLGRSLGERPSEAKAPAPKREPGEGEEIRRGDVKTPTVGENLHRAADAKIPGGKETRAAEMSPRGAGAKTPGGSMQEGPQRALEAKVSAGKVAAEPITRGADVTTPARAMQEGPQRAQDAKALAAKGETRGAEPSPRGAGDAKARGWSTPEGPQRAPEAKMPEGPQRAPEAKMPAGPQRAPEAKAPMGSTRADARAPGQVGHEGGREADSRPSGAKEPWIAPPKPIGRGRRSPTADESPRLSRSETFSAQGSLQEQRPAPAAVAGAIGEEPSGVTEPGGGQGVANTTTGRNRLLNEWGQELETPVPMSNPHPRLPPAQGNLGIIVAASLLLGVIIAAWCFMPEPPPERIRVEAMSTGTSEEEMDVDEGAPREAIEPPPSAANTRKVGPPAGATTRRGEPPAGAHAGSVTPSASGTTELAAANVGRGSAVAHSSSSAAPPWGASGGAVEARPSSAREGAVRALSGANAGMVEGALSGGYKGTVGALSGANAGMVEGALSAANKGAGGPLSGAHTGTVAPMAANMETVGLHSAANAGTVAPPSNGDAGATGPLSAGNTKTVEEALRAASPGGGELLPVGNMRTGAAGRTRTGELLPVGNTRTGEPPTGASTKEVEKALAAANTGTVVPGVPGQGRADEEVAKTGEGAVGSTVPNEGIDPGAVQRTRQQLIRALADFQTTVEVCARGRVLMGAGVYALAVTLEIVPPRREPRVVEVRRSKASYRPMPPEVKQCILEALRQRGVGANPAPVVIEREFRIE